MSLKGQDVKFIEISDYEKAGVWKQCDGYSADDSGGIP